MNWKDEAVDKLKQYSAKKQALSAIPMMMAEVESALVSIRGTKTGGISVKSSKTNGQENLLLNGIAQKEELKRNLESAKCWVSLVDQGLSVLTREERKILDRFYIIGERRAAEDLAVEYAADTKTIYKWKDKALRKFTIALYGYTES